MFSTNVKHKRKVRRAILRPSDSVSLGSLRALSRVGADIWSSVDSLNVREVGLLTALPAFELAFVCSWNDSEIGISSGISSSSTLGGASSLETMITGGGTIFMQPLLISAPVFSFSDAAIPGNGFNGKMSFGAGDFSEDGFLDRSISD